MNCPVCREPLVVVERDAIELDWCPWCKGLWFDTGELELLAERMEGAVGFDLAALVGAETDEATRPCPRCDARMDKVSLATQLVDRCPNHHGVWLDHGELGAVLSRREGAGEVVTFLGEAIRAVVRAGNTPTEPK